MGLGQAAAISVLRDLGNIYAAEDFEEFEITTFERGDDHGLRFTRRADAAGQAGITKYTGLTNT